MLTYIAQVAPTPLINPSTFAPARYANINTFVNFFTPLLMTGAALLFGGMMLWAAYTYLTAGGNADKVSQAKGMIVWAIIGIIVIVSASLVVQIVGSVLGVKTLFNL